MRRFVLAILAAALVACQSRPPAEPATVIIHNAQVYTAAQAGQATAEAVAIRGDRIVLVGSNRAALDLRGPQTRVIDAGNGTLLPGLQDSHGHFTGLGASLQVLRLRGTTSYEQIVEMVRTRAATARPGEWIEGRSWDQNDWAIKDWPSHQALTDAAPRNPVYLTRVDGHAALVNKLAIRSCGHQPIDPRPARRTHHSRSGRRRAGRADRQRSEPGRLARSQSQTAHNSRIASCSPTSRLESLD